MTTSHSMRLPYGGLVDREKELRFTFDGRTYRGHPGDTLASAFLANGIRLVGRSFKYHRPRGIFSAGAEEPSALVELRTGARREPNSRATTIELYEGLVAASQNRWPTLAFDVLALNNLLSPFLGAGFYYKTFMWPSAFWEKVYEPLIRRAAGLGTLPRTEDPDTYEKAHAYCDVLVIGSGPSGLAAALAAARSGARVILAEEDHAPGGRLLCETYDIGGQPCWTFARDALEELASYQTVTIMRRTTVFGAYDGGTYGAIERVSDHLPEPPAFVPRQRYWRIVARRTVLAAGAHERSIAFPGNDRPGVMLAGAVRTYANRFGVAAGRRLALFTNNDDGWRTVHDLIGKGVHVDVVVDTRPEVGPEVTARLSTRDTKVFTRASVCGTHGARALTAIDIRDANGRTHTVPVDCLAVSGGWNPLVHLTCHQGSKPVWNEAIAAFVPRGNPPPGMLVAGAASGSLTLAAALREGVAAGMTAAQECGFAVAAMDVPDVAAEKVGISSFWHVAGRPGRAFVDLQNDVTVKDIAIAHAEGFRSVEHLKRYTTLGMATDQGKTANVTGLAIMSELTGKPIAETGTTVFRPPYTPVAIGALASTHRGKHFRPVRLTPTHGWAAERGAIFVEAGPWLRAQWYPRAGENDWLESVDREVRSVRSGVGICDVSTLGKIDVQGGDAAIFLDRVYANTFSTLAVGRARYGLMLREDGHVMDDGTVTRLAADRYFVTTTTANAGKVMQHLQFCHQVLWPDLDVQMISVSDQWAQFSIAGPQSRELLHRIVDGQHDVSNAALPHMATAAVTIRGGAPARLFRLSFSGELAYEIAVPAARGEALMRLVVDEGADLGIVPYGTEALGVMRIEKGHPAGNELNGQTTAADLGLGKLMSRKKDYIGRVMSGRPGLIDPARPRLVGFKPVDRSARLRAGAHFLGVGKAAIAANDEGHMTSVAHSPILGHWIGLGLLRYGPDRLGEHVRAYDPVRKGDVLVEIVDPVFIDPAGERLHA